MAAKSIPGFAAFEDAWDGRAPLGWDVNDPVPVAKTVCALLSDWLPATTGSMVWADGGFHADRRLSACPADVTFDALLVLSFGGPEGPDDVRPFLENVVRGRGVPPERLDAVEEHYQHFGGVTPINARNRELIAARPGSGSSCRCTSATATGTRWSRTPSPRWPATACGAALVFATSAYGGYSACRQYHEDIARARKAGRRRRPRAGEAAPLLRPPAVRRGQRRRACAPPAPPCPPASATRPGWCSPRTRCPSAADAAAGPPAEGGHRYSRQVAEAARLVAAELGVAEHDVVWQSRSGRRRCRGWSRTSSTTSTPCTPAGVPAVVVAPVGFVSDHLEVVWDLDTEAARAGRGAGHGLRPGGDGRARTRGSPTWSSSWSPSTLHDAAPRALGGVPGGGCTVNGAPCAVDCCVPTRRPG